MTAIGGSYEQGSFFWIVNNRFFHYYSILILLVCTLVFYLVSYATREPDYARISGLTYGTVTSDQRGESRSSWGLPDLFWSGFVIVCILAAYMYFQG